MYQNLILWINTTSYGLSFCDIFAKNNSAKSRAVATPTSPHTIIHPTSPASWNIYPPIPPKNTEAYIPFTIHFAIHTHLASPQKLSIDW